MKLLRNISLSWSACLLCAFLLMAAGCETVQPGSPSGNTSHTTATETKTNPAVTSESLDRLRVGDRITIEMTDKPNPESLAQTIREDGTITLPLNLTIVAAGKTRGQLTEEIHKMYVPKYYRRMTVNIKNEERFYYVGGEVKLPGKQLHLGEVTLVQAIQSAGDFTDFGNHKNVEIIRADKRTEKVNVDKLREGKGQEVKIFPGDTIHVNRRLW